MNSESGFTLATVWIENFILQAKKNTDSLIVRT